MVPSPAAPTSPDASPAPAPAAAAATEDAHIFVNSPAKGRQVWIDGKLHGLTPVKTKVSVGQHEVRVVDAASGQTWTKTVTAEKTGRNYHNIGE
jgi:hypothetical protein